LACYTQEDIVEIEEIPQQSIARKIEDFTQNGNITKMSKTGG
jgi:hypothetical protein